MALYEAGERARESIDATDRRSPEKNTEIEELEDRLNDTTKIQAAMAQKKRQLREKNKRQEKQRDKAKGLLGVALVAQREVAIAQKDAEVEEERGKLKELTEAHTLLAKRENEIE